MGAGRVLATARSTSVGKVEIIMHPVSEAISNIGVIPVIKLNHPERDAAPFPMFKVMPTGGGSYMVTAGLTDNNKWDEITSLCRQSVEIVKEARNG